MTPSWGGVGDGRTSLDVTVRSAQRMTDAGRLRPVAHRAPVGP